MFLLGLPDKSRLELIVGLDWVAVKLTIWASFVDSERTWGRADLE
jgi:hypothetical protein